MTEITETLARRVLDTVDAGLVSGMGNPIPGQMCVEAAVNYAMDMPHGDNPPCVAPALRALKIQLNDSDWSTAQARTDGLRRLAIAQLGSADVLDQVAFVKKVSVLTIQKYVPKALRAAAMSLTGNHQDRLIACANACESDPTEANSRAAAIASAGSARASAASAADFAARSARATDFAARSAASAVFAAAPAARSAVYAASADATARAAASAYDVLLAEYCEDIVKILIDMKAPGCQWLHLTKIIRESSTLAPMKAAGEGVKP